MNHLDFNIYFTKGDCQFFLFVLDRFKDKLPYDGNRFKWFTMCHYNFKNWWNWMSKGAVPPRVWNLVHKDLCILRQKDKTIPTVQELFEEFKQLRNPN